LRLKLGLVLLVTAVCLAAALWGIDPATVKSALSQTSWSFLVPMVVLYLGAHALRTVRLRILLGTPVPFMRLYSIVSVGFLAINVVPLRLGEMVRPYLLMEREGVPFGRGIAAIVLERLLDMTMLLLLLLGLGLVIDLPPGGIVVGDVDVLVVGQRLAGTMVAAGVLVGTVLVVVGEAAIGILERLPGGPKVAPFARRFREGFLDLVRRPAQALLLVLISAGIWALTIAAVWVVMRAFPGIPATLASAWTTWTVTLTGMTAVPTPGFFGSYELFCAGSLVIWGVERDLATTFALVLHLGQFGFTVLLGSIFLVVEGVSLRSVVQASRARIDVPANPAADVTAQP
jgi:glycosyltransferase 2 family protein